jgi:hypothetical protein
MKRKPKRRSPIVADLRTPKYKPRRVRNRKRYDRKRQPATSAPSAE